MKHREMCFYGCNLLTFAAGFTLPAHRFYDIKRNTVLPLYSPKQQNLLPSKFCYMLRPQKLPGFNV